MADRAHLAHLVGQRQKRGGTGEQLASEIDAQAVGHHRHIQIVDGAGQLPDLFAAQPLRLVDQHAGAGRFHPTLDPREEIGIAAIDVGRGLDADAAGDAPFAAAIVEIGGQQVGLHPALVVVVAGLQQQRALAGIHGRIVEVEFRHECVSCLADGPPNTARRQDGFAFPLRKLWCSRRFR